MLSATRIVVNAIFLCVGCTHSRGKKTVKKKAGHVVGKPLDSFKTLHEKRLYRKLRQILNAPTHPLRHSFDSRRSNRIGRFLLPRTNTNL